MNDAQRIADLEARVQVLEAALDRAHTVILALDELDLALSSADMDRIIEVGLRSHRLLQDYLAAHRAGAAQDDEQGGQ